MSYNQIISCIYLYWFQSFLFSFKIICWTIFLAPDQLQTVPPGKSGSFWLLSANFFQLGRFVVFCLARQYEKNPRLVSCFVCVLRCRCRVPGMYYFAFHASLEDRLCVLMKLNNHLLTSFCDHRRHKRQVWSRRSTGAHRSLFSLFVFKCFTDGVLTVTLSLVPGDFRRPGGLPVKRSGGLAGDQRLQRDDGETQRLQHIFWFSAAPFLKFRMFKHET